MCLAGDLLTKELQAADPPDSSIRLDWRFIHPVDLLIHRLTSLYREADSAIYAGQTYAAGRAVSDAQRGYCHFAVEAASLARKATDGINRWLDRGMGPKAGTFESDLRKLLRQIELDLFQLPESASNRPFLERLLQSYEFIEGSISDLEETARDHGGEAESIWVEHLVRLPVHFNETLHDLQELRSQACDSSTALAERAARVQMRIDVLEKTLAPICARVMFLIEDSDLDVASLNTLCNDYRRCVADILQDRKFDSYSSRAFETSDELVQIFDQFPPDASSKADTPRPGISEAADADTMGIPDLPTASTIDTDSGKAEWSEAMSQAEIARRLLRRTTARGRDVKQKLKRYRVKQSTDRTFALRLDLMSEEDRKNIQRQFA